ncbi:hypothetical protein N7463_009959 [Penicillium fimorum]|uniref:Uncharacterized protein n=1 Tax=Penicillium fimorum TaxID=1882269 RepID=A0A9W9XIZ9_9EURO|nr:hypothetical protein N7463_009959 [Penicillium fimorum]
MPHSHAVIYYSSYNQRADKISSKRHTPNSALKRNPWRYHDADQRKANQNQTASHLACPTAEESKERGMKL